MRNRSFSMLVLLAAVVAGGFALAGEQDAPGEMTPEMMETMQKIGAPGEHHDHIARLAGDWKVEGKMWMAPGTEPTETVGKAKNRMIMGGRFLQSSYDSTFMGGPFQGMGIEGYDNMLEKHIGIWFDSMGTTIMQFAGECAKDGMVTTTVSEFVDPMTHELTTMKGTTTIVTDDQYTFESWSPGPDGKLFKSMEVTYSRM
jgi:hypothetical protein